MPKIIIKKNNSSYNQVRDNFKLDLRNNQPIEKQKQFSKKWLYLSAFLFLVVIYLGVNYWFLVSQEKPFNDLIPENAVVYSIVNQTEFYPQISSFNKIIQENNSFIQDMISKINSSFNQAGLSFSNDIQSLFKDQSVFIILPANSEASLPFLVILERKEDLAKVSQILNIIESELNKEFNLYSQDYRQIKITKISPLSNSYYNYFYAQIERYFVISNSQESLEKMVDSIINI